MQRVSLPTAAWVKPGITVLSVTALTTIGFAGPAAASGSTGAHRLPVPAKSTYRAIVNAIHTGLANHLSPRDILSNQGLPVVAGTGQQATPTFGGGKEVVYVEPQAGTFPAGMTPDLTKVTFNFHQTMSDGVTTQDVDIACNNDSSGPTDPLTPCGNLDAPLQIDQPFTINYNAAGSTLPSGFLPPASVTDTVSSSLPRLGPNFATNFSAHALPPNIPVGCLTVPSSPPVLICSNSITVKVPGAWRPIGLNLTNKATGKPLANTTFALSQGKTKLGTAKTDGSGHLTFPGIYQGGNFGLTQKTSPTGFAPLGAPLAVKVPAVTKASDAGKEYDVHVKLAPLPPTAVNDSTSTAENKAAVVKVLHNDTAVSAPLTIASVGKAHHGTAVANPDGTVTYKPNTGFSGTDTFTYAVRNALGGTDTATVTVTVIRTGVLGDRLAMTGQASWIEAELGTGALSLGGLLLFAGRRRRYGRQRAH
jgi:hypothetical protein